GSFVRATAASSTVVASPKPGRPRFRFIAISGEFTPGTSRSTFSPYLRSPSGQSIMAGKWRAWVKDRFGLQYIQQHVLDRRIPKTSWYQGDGAALLVLLATLVITGMCM